LEGCLPSILGTFQTPLGLRIVWEESTRRMCQNFPYPPDRLARQNRCLLPAQNGNVAQNAPPGELRGGKNIVGRELTLLTPRYSAPPGAPCPGLHPSPSRSLPKTNTPRPARPLSRASRCPRSPAPRRSILINPASHGRISRGPAFSLGFVKHRALGPA
jgi:hypothetical protein